MTRFMLAFLADGTLDGATILEPETVRTMETRQLELHPAVRSLGLILMEYSSNGQRVVGAVRVYRPEGRDRLSDWARQPETFRYLETSDMALLINVAHIVDVSEVPEA